MQGGASLQFSAIPMNLLNGKSANYIVTGTWSQKAYEEAQKYGTAVLATHSKVNSYKGVEDEKDWKLDNDASYTYYCDNETIHGIEFPDPLKIRGDVVCDMSSNLFSRRIDISKFGMIYACAQKNFGASGLVLVIIRQDLIGKEMKITPTCLSYKIMDQNDSLYNTPHTSGILLANLIFDWILEQGGLEKIENINSKKAAILHSFINGSKIFCNPVVEKYRSRMNVICRIQNNVKLEEEFATLAESRGFIGIRGHRSVGGLRFSLYNALSIESVEKLVLLMSEFEQKF